MTTVKTDDELSAHRDHLKRERNRRYRESHREEIRKSAREYDSKFRQTEHRKKYLEGRKEEDAQWKKEWYQRNKERILIARRKRAEETVPERTEYLKEYNKRPEVKELKRIQAERYRKKNQYQIRARRIAYKALRNGEIIKKNCEECGHHKVEMHHPNYSKELEVVWLCKRCHMIADGLLPLT